MRSSDAINDLVVSLVQAQAEFSPAVKNAENPRFRSRYLDLEGCIDAARPALLKHGLAVLQGVESDLAEQSVTVNTRLVHVTGQWIESSLTLPAINRENFDAQSIGSAVTYARRYSYMSLLGFAAEDDDANAAVANKPVVQPIAAINPPTRIQQQLKASLEITDSDLPQLDDDLSFLQDDRHPAEVSAPPVRRQQAPLIAHPPAAPAPVTRAAAAKSHSVGSVKVVSEKQAKRLWAIALGRNIAPGDVLGIVKKHGFNSVEEIGWRSYENIVAEIEAIQ